MEVTYSAQVAGQPVDWVYQLDLWMALGGSPRDFDLWVAETHNGRPRSKADCWAFLMAVVRHDDLTVNHNPPPGQLLLDMYNRFWSE